MYEAYWQLTERPFENSTDPQLYYPSESHQAAVLKLRYAVEHRRGLAVLSGPTGVGKSLVLSRFFEGLDEQQSPRVWIRYPALKPESLVRRIAVDCLPLPTDQQLDFGLLVGELEQFLVACQAKSLQPVVVIDEAQWLQEHGSLESLRLLLNLAGPYAQAESGWTFVLSGQPELVGQLQRTAALSHHVSVHCLVKPLTIDETALYIGHRLRAVGGESERIFEADAIERIHAYAQGVPRQINRLADLGLMVAYADERSRVTVDIVEGVHQELQLSSDYAAA